MAFINGYKYTTEQEAIEARQTAADYMGLPVEGGETLWWVSFQYYELDGFWYITYVEDLEKALGKPIEFEVTQPDLPY